MNLALEVLWPYRSIWCGASPCIYDFWWNERERPYGDGVKKKDAKGEMTAVGLVGGKNLTLNLALPVE